MPVGAGLKLVDIAGSRADEHREYHPEVFRRPETSGNGRTATVRSRSGTMRGVERTATMKGERTATMKDGSSFVPYV